MFRNVLVGVDEKAGGRDAVALAKTLVARDGELTFAHVYHQASPGPWRWTDSFPDKEREHARQLLEEAAAQAGVQPHIRWRGASSVGRGLHEIAEVIEADLIVVGSSRRGLLGRVRLADEMRAALNGAPGAVAVAPAGYSSASAAVTREIGVGYDGSPESEHALDVARTLAAEVGAKLSAFQAVAVPTYPGWGYTALDGTSVTELVERARAQIAAHEGVEAHAAYGDPVEELTLYSASLDLLVVGSRTYGPVGRLVHGSTSRHLARTARSPLLVLARGARTELTSAASEGRSEAVPTAG